MNPVVTIILPVHNVEGSLRSLVTSILELGMAPRRQLTLAIVDDASTDDTFEVACELARDFPQVQAYRQAQRGLGAALELVRQRLRVTEAIVHDGNGSFDLDELAKLLDLRPTEALLTDASIAEHRGSRRFAAVTALNARLADAHRAVASFRWLKLPAGDRPRRRSVTPVAVLSQLGGLASSDFPIPMR